MGGIEDTGYLLRLILWGLGVYYGARLAILFRELARRHGARGAVEELGRSIVGTIEKGLRRIVPRR